jgi:hypothetical protein
MQRIVINADFGGFSLSEKAEALYKAYAGIEQDDDKWCYWDMERNDPILLQVIDKLGINDAAGKHSDLRVVEIPDGVEWVIVEHDGKEHVAEQHRTWR